MRVICFLLMMVSLSMSLGIEAAPAVSVGEKAVYVYWGDTGAAAYRVERREGTGSYRVLARVTQITDLTSAQALLAKAPDALSRALTLKNDFVAQTHKHPDLDRALILSAAGYAQLRGMAYLDSSASRNSNLHYRITAMAADGSESLVGEIEANTRVTTPPSAPMPEVLFSGEHPQLSFSARALVRYHIERAEQNAGPWQAVELIPLVSANDGDTLRHEDKSVPQDGRSYFYRVVPYNVFELAGKPSPIVKVTTRDRTPPQAPVFNKAGSEPAASQLSWASNSENDIAGYHVYRRELLKGDDTQSMAKTGPNIRLTREPLAKTQTRYEDTRVTPGLVYQYTITAIDLKGNESAPSAPLLARPRDTQPPVAPRDIQAKVNYQGEVTMSWRANIENDVYAYRVYRAVEDGKPAFLREILLDTIAKSDRVSHKETLDVGSDVTYRYTITAVDATENESAPSQTIQVKLPDQTPPTAPVITLVQAVNGAMEIAWQPSPSEDVAGYRVYRGAHADKLVAMTQQVLPANTRAWRDGSVKSGLNWYYAVAAIDRTGHQSALSEVRSGSTFSSVQTLAPSGLVTTRVDRQWQLNWQPVPAANGYVVYISQEKEGNYVQYGSLAAAPPVTIPRPEKNARWYRVQSVYSNGAVSAMSKPLGIQLSANEVKR